MRAAVAAWGAAFERYPQVVALEDPVLQSMLAPGSLSPSSSVQSSYFVGIAQKIPWAGKRSLRGQIAQFEANAASLDSQDVQLRLTEAARLAFFEYYLVYRDLELNLVNREAVEKFRETAKAKFEATQVTQQDMLQADVELAMLKSRRIELEQNEKIAVARINTLLHREPQLLLPPPPQILEVSGELPDVDALRQMALQHRPDLTAQAARIQAEQTAVALACKEFYPDFEFMGRYDQFWTDVVQRAQVGMYVNIPLNQSRRHAAVREAIFKVNKMQAEYDSQVDSVRNDVQAGFARLEGSRKTVRLYSESVLPTAEQNVAAAYAGYEATKVDFLRLVEAERQLIQLQEKHQEAVAEYQRRRAELERAVGTPLEVLDNADRRP
ncbi:MAG: TolC family protein [Planctomycetia bacterium]|nr:TolC family protein [Planctomycetia bacterium]